jgi:hypothetical protein
MSNLDWTQLYFGNLSRAEIQEAVVDEKWQATRVKMLKAPLQMKHDTLKYWLIQNNFSRQAKVQVTNYVTALSRGGLIKPEQYLIRRNI